MPNRWGGGQPLHEPEVAAAIQRTNTARGREPVWLTALKAVGICFAIGLCVGAMAAGVMLPFKGVAWLFPG